MPIFGDKTFRKVIKVKSECKVWCPCWKRRHKECTGMEGRPNKDTGNPQSSTSQEERPEDKPNS